MDSPRTPARGINVIGMLSAGTGIGAAGRATLDALGARKIPHVAVDIDVGSYAVREPLPSGSSRYPGFSRLPYGVNVIQLNPDMFDVTLLHWYKQVGFDMLPTLNALVPFWELPHLPAPWLPILGLFDVVLAPTAFIRDAVISSFEGDALRPVVMDYPQAIRPPDDARVDRQRWLGPMAGRTAFLSVFDIRSDIERKNPWAAIQAFQSAFESRDDVALIIKVNNATSSGHEDQYRRLRELAERDSRILLIVDPLSRSDLWSLYASTDVLVSLHRSEGLGLGLMEAMAVGTPVVATAWSGNVDFMDADNSLLVPYQLVQLSGASHPLYTAEAGQRWAEPDLSAAVDALRSMADAPEARVAVGARARESVARRWAAQSQPGVFDNLLELAGSGVRESELHRSRVAAARRRVRRERASASNVWASAKRGGVALLRGMGAMAPAPLDEYRWGPPRVTSDSTEAPS